VFTRLSPSAVLAQFDDELGSLSIRRIRVGEPPGILLAALHCQANKIGIETIRRSGRQR
jgi:hypothetical protein